MSVNEITGGREVKTGIEDEGCTFAWERFGKELRLPDCPLSRTESKGSEF